MTDIQRAYRIVRRIHRPYYMPAWRVLAYVRLLADTGKLAQAFPAIVPDHARE